MNKDVESEPATWDSVTADAYRLVYGDRGALYNHPAIDYGRVVDIFRAITGIELSTEEGVLFMHAVKLSRIANGLDEGFPPEMIRDHFVDLAGYTEVLWGVLTFDQSALDCEDEE